MKLTIRKADKLESFVLMQFKGEFENNDQLASKEFMLLGDIEKLGDGNYKLVIGLMDIIGVGVELKERAAIMETVKTSKNERELIIKGYAGLKILFHKRPVPIMDRYQPRRSDVKNTFAQKLY